MKVIAVLEGYNPRYVTEEASVTKDRDEAAVFDTPRDTARLNSFLAFIKDSYTPNIRLELL